MKWIYLVIGGIAGTLCRYVLSGVVYKTTGTSFPYGTLIVNLSGCLFIGFLSAQSDEKFMLGPEMKLLWMAGFCGAFTTFSTFMLETSNLLKDGESLRAFSNVMASVALGFLCFRAGVMLGRWI